jgi:hypothetical protein
MKRRWTDALELSLRNRRDVMSEFLNQAPTVVSAFNLENAHQFPEWRLALQVFSWHRGGHRNKLNDLAYESCGFPATCLVAD